MPSRILIAEDSPAVRSALRGLLESEGSWEIVDAENGQEAVAKAQEVKPNLIILDLVMPVMDGLVAARKLSSLLPDIPLIMHTMHWSPQVELEAQKAGVRKVVSKADSNLLVATVRHFLDPVLATPIEIPSNLLTTDAASSTPMLKSDGTPAPKTTDLPLSNQNEDPQSH